MKLKDKVVIVTGAAGGIGSEVTLAFAAKGSKMVVVDRSEKLLAPLCDELKAKGAKCIAIAADITVEDDIKRIVSGAAKLGDIDILVNNAGIMPFKLIKDHTASDVMNSLMVNVYGPMRLVQEVLPGMLKRDSGRVVNIGSTFGSLAFPYFGVYSATKSAMRSFSEALRRELQGSGVGVTYVAPRGTKTSQPELFFEMAKKMSMNLDNAAKVAGIVVNSVEKDKSEVAIGGPEKFFALVNKLKPSLVDGGLKKQIKVMAEYCPRLSK